MKMARGFAAAVAAILCLQAVFAQEQLPEGVKKKFFRSGHETQSCYIYVPPKAPKDTPLPLMVLVPPAGLTGMNEIAGWNKILEASPMVTVGINVGQLSADWNQLYDRPEWIHDAVEEAKKIHPVDGRHMYLWGDSSGAAFAFYFAFLESQYFAAAAVYGGVIQNFRFGIADLAARKIPIAYFIGTRDGWWTLEQTRSVRDALTTRGFPVHYVELKGADHNFFGHMEEVTNDAWEFLSQQSLDAEPKFAPIDREKVKRALK